MPLKKVLLVGLGPSTFSALQCLSEKFEIVGLIRECPAADEAGDPALRFAKQARIPVCARTTVSDIRLLVDEQRPDCVVVSTYNRIIPAELLARCPFLNVHYAPLPRYRGRANVNWAILNGETQTGITIHRMQPGLDAGNVLFQQLVPIRNTDTAAELYEQLNLVQREALPGAVERLLAGDAGVPQDEQYATYGCARNPEDGEIRWDDEASAICRQVRALSPPFPGAFTFHQGRKLYVWRAELVKNPPHFVGRIPGRPIRVAPAEGHVDVLTGDGVLRLIEVQRDGGSRVSAASIIRSVRDTLGMSSYELLKRIESLERQLRKTRDEAA